MHVDVSAHMLVIFGFRMIRTRLLLLNEPIDQIADKTDAESSGTRTAIIASVFTVSRPGNVDMCPRGLSDEFRQEQGC